MRLQEDLSIVLEIQNWGENFIVEFICICINLVPSAFLLKKMEGAPAPLIFFREKPWGQGWYLYNCCIWCFRAFSARVLCFHCFLG